jgi:Na+-translocating ferredoxin:NAD+ oxidoreductase RnfA subunit
LQKTSKEKSTMESFKMGLFFAVMIVLMAALATQNAAATDAPAPSPTSDATLFAPTMFASLAALAFGFLF